MEGVIETATGDLLRYGNVDFATDGAFNPGTESVRTDIRTPGQTTERSGGVERDFEDEL